MPGAVRARPHFRVSQGLGGSVGVRSPSGGGDERRGRSGGGGDERRGRSGGGGGGGGGGDGDGVGLADTATLLCCGFRSNIRGRDAWFTALLFVAYAATVGPILRAPGNVPTAPPPPPIYP